MAKNQKAQTTLQPRPKRKGGGRGMRELVSSLGEREDGVKIDFKKRRYDEHGRLVSPLFPKRRTDISSKE
jgi:hypothetical protein